jgi:hypothetical protein
MPLKQEYEHTFVGIVPCDDFHFNDMLIQSLYNQYPRVGHAFSKQQHMRKGGGYLFLSWFSSMYDAIHGWMTGQTDGWMDGKSFTKNNHDVLYYM